MTFNSTLRTEQGVALTGRNRTGPPAALHTRVSRTIQAH